MARESYDHLRIEREAREKWEKLGLYAADISSTGKEPYYLLTEFPYPSGDLHTGHWYAFALPDIFARYLRMQGKNVLFPIGFDAFGLPAENAAIKHGKNPAAWTEGNMQRMREQLASMGASFDWSRALATCDPAYYHWTQWLFAKLFEQGLAYRAEASVKWCPKDATVLANEQVIDGACERCGTTVEEKRLTQWFLRITDYAERLLQDLDPLPWREDIKDAQRAWIGKSEGARLAFELVLKKNQNPGAWRDHEGKPARVEVFTTRPETVFGVTYIVLAPEHAWVRAIWDTPYDDAVNNKAEVAAYVEATAKKTERERQENKEKTGVRLEGIMAINPATKEEIPVYVADYVLGSYGTGAVMAVPAHDERDFEFAQKYGLPMRTVIEPKFANEAPAEEAIRLGEEIIRREAICAVVRNPKDDTFLCNSWKTAKMNGLFTGGIDDGEDVIEAARREVREETGYKNLRHIERPELSINTFFYHRVKKQNRWAHFRFVFFELEDEERNEVDAEEAALHEVVWKKRDELKDFFTVFEGDFIAEHLDGEPLCFIGDGILANSGGFDQRGSKEAKWEIVDAVGGTRETQYRLRDWLVSRQRYWGCPIPIVYDPEGNPHSVPAEHFPWLLPTDVDFTPTAAASPLASSQELRDRVALIFGEGWTPEFDTLDTFVDSSWYFTRYLAPADATRFSDPVAMGKWLPVNRYSGGSEHTTMHLLYSRFFYKALYDLSLVPTAEPFVERLNRGLIMGPDGQKMSKSKGNVINPDEYVQKHGADAVRLYLAFIGPYNEPGHYPWKPEVVFSMRKFLDRIHALREKVDGDDVSETIDRALAKATAKIGPDIERFKLNTAVSALMVLVSALEKEAPIPRQAFRQFLALVAPFAPHLTEAMFAQEFAAEAGEGSVHQEPWPAFDPSLLMEDEIVIGVQVAGKKRGEIALSPDASQEEAVEKALQVRKVADQLPNGSPSRVIYVPGRILNLIP